MVCIVSDGRGKPNLSVIAAIGACQEGAKVSERIL